mmetsp:Transcript_62375/g.103578  ORF Transcript_62375/g.103578 Transcript_62375/m.103578 type:complete len:103 (+) Transcript_62375:475-783(+)
MVATLPPKAFRQMGAPKAPEVFFLPPSPQIWYCIKMHGELCTLPTVHCEDTCTTTAATTTDNSSRNNRIQFMLCTGPEITLMRPLTLQVTYPNPTLPFSRPQ